MKQSIVVLLSGGLDSSTLLASLQQDGWNVIALSILYGQRHKKEILASEAIAHHYHVEHQVVDISTVQSLFAGSALTSADIAVPHGHYTDSSMKSTVVPNRNMVFLSLAGALAVSRKAQAIAYAAHAGDHTIYPDCRTSFIASMREAFALCDWEPVSLLTPFASSTKADIVSLGIKLQVPYELTWSCYEGGTHHCGQCGTCVERIEAFQLAQATDPTTYQV